MSTIEANSWRSVQHELLRRINDRVWPPGTPLPSEADLASEFGCARATVNRAMRELAEAGLIDRKRKAGSRVALHRISRVVIDIPMIRLEVEQRNAKWGYSLIKQSSCPAPLNVTGRVGLAPGSRMIHVTSIHFADNHPFLHEDRWINAEALPGVEKVDFAKICANEWLIQNAPYTAGDISLSAVNATPELAQMLETRDGAALFVLDRITWNGKQPITSVRLSYAPGYRMTTRL